MIRPAFITLALFFLSNVNILYGNTAHILYGNTALGSPSICQLVIISLLFQSLSAGRGAKQRGTVPPSLVQINSDAETIDTDFDYDVLENPDQCAEQLYQAKRNERMWKYGVEQSRKRERKTWDQNIRLKANNMDLKENVEAKRHQIRELRGQNEILNEQLKEKNSDCKTRKSGKKKGRKVKGTLPYR